MERVKLVNRNGLQLTDLSPRGYSGPTRPGHEPWPTQQLSPRLRRARSNSGSQKLPALSPKNGVLPTPPPPMVQAREQMENYQHVTSPRVSGWGAALPSPASEVTPSPRMRSQSLKGAGSPPSAFMQQSPTNPPPREDTPSAWDSTSTTGDSTSSPHSPPLRARRRRYGAAV
eukprot:EC791114.1.p1 GENE.EC791114.1~~EC791114.1.p1  ORF type:complete len:172 (+),score=27.49 EC791114.1:1-516(+)